MVNRLKVSRDFGKVIKSSVEKVFQRVSRWRCLASAVQDFCNALLRIGSFCPLCIKLYIFQRRRLIVKRMFNAMI